MKVLEYRDVRRAYEPGHDVLHGLSFAVGAGEVVGLLGRNGAGKTTLIRLAMGLLAPRRGEVRVLGLDPRRDAVAVKRRVGYVAEDRELPAMLRVDEALALHRRLFPTWDDALAAELGADLKLPARARVGELSKGQARRLALLCAIAHRPELLLLDEPAGGLDPAARREFLEAAIRLLGDGGTTIVFSSHHMTDVERLASRVVMVEAGQLVLDRDLDALREGFALALLRGGDAQRRRLLALDDCLVVREQDGVLRVVMRLDPEAAGDLLRRELGAVEARAVRVSLEDLFIELAGGRS